MFAIGLSGCEDFWKSEKIFHFKGCNVQLNLVEFFIRFRSRLNEVGSGEGTIWEMGHYVG